MVSKRNLFQIGRTNQNEASLMFSLVSGAYEQWTRRKIQNVLIVGLDGAGKTVNLWGTIRY
jgi:signal recognition particle GTPase